MSSLYRRHLPELLALVALGALLVFGVVTAWSADTDADGMEDAYEVFMGLNPTNAADVWLDPDGDALSNLDESIPWTDPFAADTDRDGWNDGPADSNPVSRAWCGWGDPRFIDGDDYVYTWPEWAVAAARQGGVWDTNAPAWIVQAEQ